MPRLIFVWTLCSLSRKFSQFIRTKTTYSVYINNFIRSEKSTLSLRFLDAHAYPLKYRVAAPSPFLPPQKNIDQTTLLGTKASRPSPEHSVKSKKNKLLLKGNGSGIGKTNYTKTKDVHTHSFWRRFHANRIKEKEVIENWKLRNAKLKPVIQRFCDVTTSVQNLIIFNIRYKHYYLHLQRRHHLSNLYQFCF